MQSRVTDLITLSQDDGISRVFQERLSKRLKFLWSPPQQLYRPANLRSACERYLQKRVLLSRNDPMERWQHGVHWQRRLSNKWNSREFAAKFGFQLPELYWYGRRPNQIPFAKLPDSYVIRGAWGSASRNVCVVRDGYELLRDKAITPQDLVDKFSRVQDRFWPFPLLVEELLKPARDSDALTEYSFHTFNGVVAAIVVTQGRKRGVGSSRVNFYRPDWTQLPCSLRTKVKMNFDFNAPECLDDMLDCAKVLGTAYRSYVRNCFDRGPKVHEKDNILPTNKATGNTVKTGTISGYRDELHLESPEGLEFGDFGYKYRVLDDLVLPPYVTPARYALSRRIETREKDICFTSFPKSGSTWLAHVLVRLVNGGEAPDDAPLRSHLHWVESSWTYPRSEQELAQMLSPRIFKSHMPYRMALGGNPREEPCKHIYIARNPKDVAVSYYHFEREQAWAGNYDGPWEHWLDLFLSGRVQRGDWFSHALGWWQNSDAQIFSF